VHEATHYAIFPSLLSFLPVRPEYHALHPILEHPQPMFFPHCKRPRFTPTKTTSNITLPFILLFSFDGYKQKLIRATTFGVNTHGIGVMGLIRSYRTEQHHLPDGSYTQSQI
jgi:hypothetical protein